jgi:hypothetical protein
MVLVEGVGEVVLAGTKIEKNLALADAVTKPVPSHVHGFGPLLLHGAIDKTVGSGVIQKDPKVWTCNFGGL